MSNSVENLTKYLKDILLKTKQELKNKDDYKKTQRTVQDLSKKSEIVRGVCIGQETTSAM